MDRTPNPDAAPTEAERGRRQRFVVDTSVFTNPDVYTQFGPSPPEAAREFLAAARRSGAEFFMPRSIYREIALFKELAPVVPEIEAFVRVRSPRRLEVMVPGQFLYEFIQEVRLRVDRGLRVAEEHARMGWQAGAGTDVGKVVTRLRERYREVLRQGIVDSREDADVLLLAYELDGVLVSADEGLLTWADKVGVEIIESRNLRAILEALGEGGGTPPG